MARGNSGMSRIQPFDQRRSAVDKILDGCNNAAAKDQALTEIRLLIDGLRENAVIPTRRIRQILRKHGQ